MKKCAYPKCIEPAARTPLVEVPTIRTAGDTDELIRTDRPTILIFDPICLSHCKYYKLSDWMDNKDWHNMQGEAKLRGYTLPDREFIVVRFMPLDWNPSHRYMEIER